MVGAVVGVLPLLLVVVVIVVKMVGSSVPICGGVIVVVIIIIMPSWHGCIRIFVGAGRFDSHGGGFCRRIQSDGYCRDGRHAAIHVTIITP